MVVVSLAVLVLLALGGVAPSHAQPVAERATTVEQALDLVGMKAKIEHVPRLVQTHLLRQPAPPDVASGEAVVKALRETFDGDRLYPALVRALERNGDQARMAVVVAELGTPLSRRMTALEVAVLTPEAMSGMMTFAARMMVTDRPTPERVDLVRRLDVATGTTELNLALEVVTRHGVSRVVDLILPAGQRRNPPSAEQTLAALPPSSRESARTATEIALLYTYRSIGDDELRRYVEQAESDTGRWFAERLRAGLVEVLRSAAEAAQAPVREALQGKRRI